MGFVASNSRERERSKRRLIEIYASRYLLGYFLVFIVSLTICVGEGRREKGRGLSLSLKHTYQSKLGLQAMYSSIETSFEGHT